MDIGTYKVILLFFIVSESTTRELTYNYLKSFDFNYLCHMRSDIIYVTLKSQ